MLQIGARFAGPIRSAPPLALVPAAITSLAILLALSIAGSGRAQTKVTSTLDDGGPGTLRTLIDAEQDAVLQFSIPTDSLITFVTDPDTLRVLPTVFVESDVELDGGSSGVSITAAGQIFFVGKGNEGAALKLREVAILGGEEASILLSAATSSLEVRTDVGDRTWGDASSSPAIINGLGKFIKSGAHVLTLFGKHGYGDTEILDGTLAFLDASGLTGDFFLNKNTTDPDVVNDDAPRLIFTGSVDRTVTGSIQNNGGITGDIRGVVLKQGSGRVAFTSAMGIDADISVLQGTMSVSAVPVSTSVDDSMTIAVADGAIFEFDIDLDTEAVYGAEITGGGDIAKSGGASLLFDGTTTEDWTGSMIVKEGRLAVLDVDLLPGSVVFTGDDAEFELRTGSDNVVFSKNITTEGGSGTVVMSGTGELWLKGSNSYSKLQVGEKATVRGSTSGIRGDVELAEDSKLIFDQNGGSGTHSGDIIGPEGAGVTIISGGTVTLDGDNQYGGGTIVEGDATLVGDSESLQGEIMLEELDNKPSKLVFNQKADGAFGDSPQDDISGAGSVEKTGSGTLTVIGAEWRHLGNTTVKNGGLVLDGGSLVNDAIIVESGGFLGGAGSVTALSGVNVSGAVAPGLLDGIGTLAVNADITFQDGSRLEVDLAEDGTGDMLTVGGAVGIISGASLIVTPKKGNYPNEVDVTVLSSSGIKGTFAPVIDDFAFLDIEASYTNNLINVTIAPDDRGVASLPGLTANQRAVGAALDAADVLDPSHPLSETFRPMKIDEVPGALDQLAGLPISSSFSARLAEGGHFGRTILRRVRAFADRDNASRDWTHAARPAVGSGTPLAGALMGGAGGRDSAGAAGSAGWGTWLDGYGAFGGVDASRQSPGFDYSIAGIAAGFDYQVATPLMLGAAFGYARTGIKDFTNVDAKSSGNTYRTSLYGSFTNSLGYLGARADYAYADFEYWREIEFQDISERARGSYGGHEFSGALEVGTRPFERWELRALPFVSLGYTHLGRESFAETNAPLTGLDVSLEAYNSLALELGGMLDHTVQIDSTLRIRGELRLSYTHEFLDHRPIMQATYTGQPFEVAGTSTGRDTGLVGVSLEFVDRNNLSTFVGYDLRANSKLLEHNVSLGILVYF